MDRKEAIDAIQAAWWLRDQEFCSSPEDFAQSDAELLAALTALGVTEAEMRGAPVV